MRHRWASTVILIGTVATLTANQGTSTAPTDWPQWRGPERNGLSRETGLLKQWPAAGPPVAWTTSSLGGGYGTVAVKDDRIFVQGSNGKQSILYVLSRL